MSFSQSEIINDPESTNFYNDQPDQNFNVSDDTALMIDELHNPYAEALPNNFTEEQKMRWMMRADHQQDEEDFLLNFEQNQRRYRPSDDNFSKR